jgi:microcystin degradation protein MlrC
VARAKRVLIAGLYHETHTFVPGQTSLADFTILRGPELWQAVGEPSPLGGAMETARACGWDVCPAIDYRASPSGIVADAVLDAWWQAFEEAAHVALQEGPVQGVFLVLHGAMVTETCPDVEGEILQRIRALPALAQTRLVGVTDLHANVSARMAALSDALVTYRQNPHTDAKATAERAAHILDSLLETNTRVQTLWRQLPLILAPTATGTADDPMRTWESFARRMEEDNPDFLAVNIHAGFAFADTFNTGVSFTIPTVRVSAEAERQLTELCDIAMRTPLSRATEELSLESALARLAQYDTGPILLVEPSDNIGAGAPGEGVALLKALIARDIRNAGVIVNDPEAVATLAKLSDGDRCTLRFGGKSSPLYGGGCELDVALVSRSNGRFTLEDPRSHLASMVGSHVDMGPCAVVRHRGVLILLTTRATAPFDLGQWRSQGIAPESLFAIGVKAAVAHRQAYDPIARATIYVDTPGPCRSDLRTLPFQQLRRPIRPLDNL